jgi:hypothetical protein
MQTTQREIHRAAIGCPSFGLVNMHLHMDSHARVANKRAHDQGYQR